MNDNMDFTTNSTLEMKYRYPISMSIGGAILLYFILFTLSWVILFTFNPSMVHDSSNALNNTAPSASKCFVASLIIALIVCIIIWLFMRVC